MKSNQLILDSAETLYFENELEHVKALTYDKKHKALKGIDGRLIPISAEADTGAETIKYRSYDMVGAAKIIADYSSDFPRVDVLGEELSVNVKSLGDSYGYTIQEIRRSRMANKSLETRRAIAAKRAIDELQNTIALQGDATANLKGLINIPNMSEYSTPNGAGGDTEWATKTPTEIMADIKGIFTTVINATNGIEVPDTFLMPLANYNILAFTDYGDSRDKTLLQKVRETFPQLTTIDWLTELATAGDGGSARMMMYVNDAEHLTLEIPQAFEQFPYQQVGQEYKVDCHQRTAGVICYYPLSVAYGDDI